jgi:hypothetical protein
MTIVCPGRMTKTHDQFLADNGNLSGLSIMVLDCSSAELAYSSNSRAITLCTNEKYILEVHKMLALPNSKSIIEEVWTDPNRFDQGRNIAYVENRLKWLNYKSAKRGTRSWNWTDVAIYYCLLSQGGFNYHFRGWSLQIDKHNPVRPDFPSIERFSLMAKDKRLLYRRRTIFNFPIQEVDKETTLIYIHIPIQFSQYGCGYVWTRRKLRFVQTQLVELASMGYRVCVSTLHSRWGRQIPMSRNLLPEDLFRPSIYTVLKDSSSYGLNNLTQEAYYAAGI